MVINIIDASNIERNLYLTIQLLEFGLPLVVVLNMMDIAKKKGVKIDLAMLSQRLGCPIVPVVATTGEGEEELRKVINESCKKKNNTICQVRYSSDLMAGIEKIEKRIVEENILKDNKSISSHILAIKLLENGETLGLPISQKILEEATSLRSEIKNKNGESSDVIFADSRYTAISTICKDVVKKAGEVKRPISDFIDAIVLNRFLGIPIFFAAMYLMFMLTINIGGAFIDFFDNIFGLFLVDGLALMLKTYSCPEWLISILADGFGAGIQTIATFIPQIGMMFICLCFLEDSGYMARAAFVMDRFMRFIGLPGKSFIPMLVGFGCNVPAIMATRTLENQRDRRLTIMMNPFMSCGARLPVYALFVSVFFASHGHNLVFALYLIGVCFAIISGFILKHTLLKGKLSPFIMELPPYHIPTIKGVLLRAWERLRSFIFRAGRVIVPIMMIFGFVNSWGVDGTFSRDNGNKSMLSAVAKGITPAFEPMGISEDNWPATLGIFTGVFAKEAVVGTLDAIYSQLGEEENEESEEEEFNLVEGIKDAFKSIPENLVAAVNSFSDPLRIEDESDSEVSSNTFSTIKKLFHGEVGAFAYLLFVLLYSPCVASLATIYRELNLRWAIFSCAWSTGVAYIVATLFYQIATFNDHSEYSTNCFVYIGIFVVCSLVGLSVVGKMISRKTEI